MRRLSGIHIAVSLVWLTFYAWFLSGFRAVLSGAGVSGGLLVFLGLRLAWERR